MSTEFNIYCDESCHLEHDNQKAMVLGAVWCPLDKVEESRARIKEIKVKHGLPPWFEMKWTRVSPARHDFYLDILDYFFDDDDLHYRAVVVPDKEKLAHDRFQHTHDTFYYKMYFEVISQVLKPRNSYSIYIDIKDTRSQAKVVKLREVLANSLYDFDMEIVQKIQQVRSNEVQHLQLADLLTGCVSYANRALSSSTAKVALVDRMKERSHYSLVRTTLLSEDKVNLLVWQAR